MVASFCAACGKYVRDGKEAIDLKVGTVGADYDDFELTEVRATLRYKRDCFTGKTSLDEFIESIMRVEQRCFDGMD